LADPVLGDLQRTHAQLRAVEADMVSVLGELGLSRLGDVPGLTATGAAAILAETGGPRRYDSSSSLVKHAGLAPSDNASGALCGQAHISRRGRPGLRLAVWHAVWPMLRLNPVMAAKYQALTQAGDAAAQAASVHDGARTRPATAAAPASTSSVTSRRQPDQRLPAPARVPQTFLPEEGDSEPAATLRISLVANPGQLSPGHPELLTSPVERCRGRPAAPCGQAEPVCTT
jgi:Transposase IS116/IS110/IS902 family